MKIKRFEDLTVWQKSRDLSVAIYRITQSGHFAQDHGLRNQIRRAAVSVMSNIAEGFDRYSRAEFRQFLSISRGSASEVRSQLHLALRWATYRSPSSTGSTASAGRSPGCSHPCGRW